ncbi:hypothetical protein [Pyxidicoccus fallax]|nr:hypothetical protein [Pyxidicoccus fallax]
MLFALLPLPAILLGAYVTSRSGTSAKAFAVNGAAVVLGTAMTVAVGRLSDATLRRVSVVAVLLTASTLLFTGLDGVRRWMELGPVRLHASSVFAPWVLVAISASLHRRFALSVVLALAMSAIHVAQPDAGQGTAFALAAVTLLARARSIPWPRRALGCAGVLALGLAAWFRVDPLHAVPHVERIVHLAAAQGPVLGALAVLSLALLFVPSVWTATRAPTSDAPGAMLSVSLAVYLAVTVLVTELGNFPVPVLGAGAGAVLGWYAMTGMLVASWRHSSHREASHLGAT